MLGWLRGHSRWVGLAVTFLILAAGGAYGFREHRHEQFVAKKCDAVEQVEVDLGTRRNEALRQVDGPVIAFVGDSYTQGQWLDDPLKSYAYVVADDFAQAPYVDGRGGTGFENGGPCGDQEFFNRVGRAAGQRPTLLILQGGLNDAGLDDVAESTDLAIRLARVSANGARTTIVVIGTFTPPGADPELTAAANREIERAAESAEVLFIDPSTWDFPVMDDQIHPTVAGHEAIGHRVTEAILAAVAS